MDNEYYDQNGYNDPYSNNGQYDPNAYNGYDQNAYNGYNGYYGQQPYYQPAERTNPLAIVSLVLGIVSVVIAVFLCCYSFGINLPFAIAALVTGIIQLKSKTNQKGRGMSTAGIITGSVSIVLSIVYLIIFIAIIIFSIIADSSSSYDYYF